MENKDVAKHIEEAIEGGNPLYQTVSPLPIKNGASPRDFKIAKWINDDLNKKAYTNPVLSSTSGDAIRLEMIKQKQIEVQKEKAEQEFHDQIHSIFDPLSLKAAETSRLTGSR